VAVWLCGCVALVTELSETRRRSTEEVGPVVLLESDEGRERDPALRLVGRERETREGVVVLAETAPAATTPTLVGGRGRGLRESVLARSRCGEADQFFRADVEQGGLQREVLTLFHPLPMIDAPRN
jgi:hypothetical protein